MYIFSICVFLVIFSCRGKMVESIQNGDGGTQLIGHTRDDVVANIKDADDNIFLRIFQLPFISCMFIYSVCTVTANRLDSLPSNVQNCCILCVVVMCLFLLFLITVFVIVHLIAFQCVCVCIRFFFVYCRYCSLETVQLFVTVT